MLPRKIILFLVIASFLVSLNFSPALAAPQRIYKASFLGVATGESLILPDYVPSNVPPKEFFIEKGAISVSGSAVVRAFPLGGGIPYPFYLAQGCVKAQGEISANWSGHEITASLFSNGEALSIFVEESPMGGIFAVGMLGAEMMSFKAIYKDPAGTHVICGKAVVEATSMDSVMGILVMLFRPDGTPLLTMLWVQEDSPFGPATLHAAHPFIHSVEITRLH